MESKIDVFIKILDNEDSSKDENLLVVSTIFFVLQCIVWRWIRKYLNPVFALLCNADIFFKVYFF